MALLLFIWLFAATLHISLMAFWAWAVRMEIAEVSFGLGPLVGTIGRTSIRLFPTGGFVRLAENATDHPVSVDRVTFEGAPLWKKLVIVVAPICTLLAVCWVALGQRAFDSFVAGFTQFALGAWSPLQSGQGLLLRLVEVCASESLAAALAIVCTKLCVLNTVPFTGTNGGTVVVYLLAALGMSERQIIAIQYVLLLLFLPLILSWMVAVVWFVWKSVG